MLSWRLHSRRGKGSGFQGLRGLGIGVLVLWVRGFRDWALGRAIFFQGWLHPGLAHPFGDFLQFPIPKAAHIVSYSIESFSRTIRQLWPPSFLGFRLFGGFVAFSFLASRLQWLLASWLLGFGSFLASVALGFLASWLWRFLGFSASVASVASWLLGFPASWLLGFSGFVALGFSASVASWLRRTQTTSFPGSLHESKPELNEGLN